MEAKCLEIVETEDKYESLQKDFSTAVEQHAELLSQQRDKYETQIRFMLTRLQAIVSET